MLSADDLDAIDDIPVIVLTKRKLDFLSRLRRQSEVSLSDSSTGKSALCGMIFGSHLAANPIRNQLEKDS